MVYPPEDVTGATCVNFVHAPNAANHYATPWGGKRQLLNNRRLMMTLIMMRQGFDSAADEGVRWQATM